MIITIRKETALDMFKKLRCGGIFKDVVLTFKDGCLTSHAVSKDKKIRRMFTLHKTRFDVVGGEEFSFLFDVNFVSGFFKLAEKNSETKIDLDKKNSRMKIIFEDESKAPNLPIKIVKTIIDETFEWKHKYPRIKDKIGTVSLDSRVVMPLKSLKLINYYMGAHKTGLINFTLPHDTRKLSVFIGDENYEYTDMFVDYQVYKVSEDVDIKLNNNTQLRKVFSAFNYDVQIFMRTNFPMFMSEIREDDLDFSVLIS